MVRSLIPAVCRAMFHGCASHCRILAEKELQFKTIDPPKPRLEPGEVVHFETPFTNPPDAATGVVVTFAPS